RNALPEDFAGVIDMLARNKDLPLEETVSRVVPLNDAPQAFADWSADPLAVSKILVELN
ncbi:MAG: sorbitol dehydrogenase, partial [Acidobacteria bacterium]|nr:sorbitol dehydrogenase [Acidobacteriota bacterium]